MFGSDGVSNGVVFGRGGRGIKVLRGGFGGVVLEGLVFCKLESAPVVMDWIFWEEG